MRTSKRFRTENRQPVHFSAKIEALESRLVLSADGGSQEPSDPPIPVIELSPDQPVTVTGTLTDIVDEDSYRLQVAADGFIRIAQSPNSPIGLVAHVLAEDGTEVAPLQLLSSRPLTVRGGPNQPLFLHVSPIESEGDYELIIESRTDDVGPAGLDVTPNDAGLFEFLGSIQAEAETDVFHLQPDVNSALRISLDAEDLFLDPVLTVVDRTTGEQLGFNDDGDGLNSRLNITVAAHQSVSIIAAGFTTAIGDYRLRVVLQQDIGDTPETAKPLPIVAGIGTVDSELSAVPSGFDRDFFSIIAPSDGLIRVSVDQRAGFNLLDSLVAVRNQSGEIIAINDDRVPLAATGSLVEFNARQGERYTIEVRPFDIVTAFPVGDRTGEYTLIVEQFDQSITDSVGNTFSTAQPIPLNDGFALERVSIDYAADQDLYQFTAPANGTVIVTHRSVDDPMAGYLTIFDDSPEHRTISRSTVPASPHFNSELEFEVEQGKTYYIRASVYSSESSERYGQATGAYGLGVAFRNRSLQTTTFETGQQTSRTFSERIDTPDDVDQFLIYVSQSGPVSIDARQTDIVSTVDWMLSAFLVGDEFEYAGHQVRDFGLDLNIELADALAGQYYLIVVQGNGSGVGEYALTISQPRPDDLPGITELVLGNSVSGEIGSNDDDSFLLNLAPGDVAELIVERIDLAFSPALSVASIGGPTVPVFVSGDDALRPIRVLGGDQPIFVFLSGDFDAVANGFSVGRYRVSLRTAVLDGFAEDFATAEVISSSTQEVTSVNNQFESSTDSDFYQYTATFTGQLQIQQSDFDPSGAPAALFNQVFVYDSRQTLITSGGDVFGPASGDATVFVDVVEGEHYFIELRNGDLKTGGYQLELDELSSADDVGPDGRDLTLDEQGIAAFSGAIDAAGDTDEFHLQSVSAGTSFLITLDANNSPLDPVLRVVNQTTGELIAFNDDGNGINSRLTVTIPTEQDVSIIAAGFGTRTGAYRLRVEQISSTDDVDAAGVDLELDDQGATEFTGRIDTAVDTDVFLLQPEVDTTLSITLDAMDAQFDPVLRVTDRATGALIGFNDDSVGLNSRLTLTIAAQQAISITVSGYALTNGRYRLGITPVTVTDEIDAGGRDLVFDAQGVAEVSSTIDVAGDTDVFHLPSGLVGSYLVTLNADDGGRLDPFLQLVDDIGLPLDSNDDGGEGLNSSLLVTLTGTSPRSLVASGFGSSAGRYQLRIRPFEGTTTDDPDRDLDILESEVTELTGRIDAASDTDVFTFTATFNGSIVIEQNADEDFLLDPLLRVRTIDGVQIAVNDDGGFGTNSRISIDVRQNQTYQIIAGGFGSSTGAYRLVITQPADQSDVSDTFSQATPLIFTDESSFFQGGSIVARPTDSNADIDVFRLPVSSFTGTLNIRLAAFDAGLNPGLAVFTGNTNGGAVDNLVLVALADSDPLIPDQVSLFANIQANTEYFVRVSGMSGSVGSYFLGASATIDAVPSTFAGAVELPVGGFGSTVTQVSSIDFSNDRDMFQVTAPKAGRFTVTLRHRQDSALDPVLAAYGAVYNNGGNTPLPIGRNDDDLPGSVDSELTFDAHRDGEVFFLEARGLEDSIGEYEITVTFGDAAFETAGVPLDAESIYPSQTMTSVQAQGQFDSARDVDFFTFVATENGRVRSRVTVPSGSHDTGSVRILQADDNVVSQRGIDALTQIASGDSLIEFDVMAGQRYFIELRDQFMSGAAAVPYSLDVQFEALDVQLVSPKDGTVNDTINEAFQTTLAGVSLDAAADAVLAQLKRKFGVGPDQRLEQTYFVLLLDPVDFLLTDPSGRSVGFTANTGAVNETRNAYYSGDGFGELVVLTGIQMGSYQIELSSVGGLNLGEAVRFMAVGPDGAVPINASIQAGQFNPDAGKTGVLLALDVGTTQVFPNNTNGVFAQLANRSLDRPSAVIQDHDELALVSLQSRSDLYSAALAESLTLQEIHDGARDFAHPITDRVRSFVRALDDVFGLDIEAKLKKGRLSGKQDPEGAGDMPLSPLDLVPTDGFWWHLGKVLIDTPGALLDLMDGITSPAKPEQQRDEPPAPDNKVPEKATSDRAQPTPLEQPAARLLASQKSQEYRHPFGRNFRKPSPWDDYPKPVDFSWPWAITEEPGTGKVLSKREHADVRADAVKRVKPVDSQAAEAATQP